LNSSLFNNRIEALKEANTQFLDKPFWNKLFLILLNRSISFPFDLIEPLMFNNIGIWGVRNQSLCVVTHPCLTFSVS